MRRVRRTVFLAGLVTAGLVIGGAGGYPALAATANSPTGSWGTAINVPGTSAAAGAQVASVSCAPRAECTMVGSDFTGNTFAITEKNGVWGKTRQIPGVAKGGPPSLDQVNSVSCPASGACLAVGTE